MPIGREIESPGLRDGLDESNVSMISAGEAALPVSKRQKKDHVLGQTNTKQHTKMSSLRYFPVQVNDFHTGGLLNESVVEFGFDDPAQRSTIVPRLNFLPMGR